MDARQFTMPDLQHLLLPTTILSLPHADLHLCAAKQRLQLDQGELKALSLCSRKQLHQSLEHECQAHRLLPGAFGQLVPVFAGERAGVAHERASQGHIARQGGQLGIQSQDAGFPARALASQPCDYTTLSHVAYEGA